MLTKKQKQILDFIQTYIKKNDYSPTLEEIANYFKLSSIATVHQHVAALKQKGYLNTTENQRRSINVFSKEKFISVPLLGTIAAGGQIEMFQQSSESIAIPKTKIKPNQDYFALKVTGESMIEKNIDNGDVVLVKQQSVANNGDKVVALIDNSETTLKTFYKEKNCIRLQPANKNMQPIIINKDRDFSIQGVVADVIKNENSLLSKNIFVSDRTKRSSSLALNKIVLGDALEELKKLPNESCDVIIIDPPYNIGKNFGNNSDKRELKEYIEWCKSWINESIRVMKPTATIFIYGFSEILAYLSVEIPINKRWLIWHYTNKNVASLNFWQRSHESIICAWKDVPIFNKDNIREPYTEGFLNGAAGKVRKKTVGRFSSGNKETIYNAHEGGALPRDVIKIPALAGGAGMNERWFICKTCNENVFAPRELKKHVGHEIIKHPTQKPLELCKKLIKSAMPQKNGVVLVPFVGTGAECLAAKELGQNYVGFEINPDYIKIAQKTIASI
jgi:site-specific DNA-methyltransferase (adenine-specific)